MLTAKPALRERLVDGGPLAACGLSTIVTEPITEPATLEDIKDRTLESSATGL